MITGPFPSQPLETPIAYLCLTSETTSEDPDLPKGVSRLYVERVLENKQAGTGCNPYVPTCPRCVGRYLKLSTDRNLTLRLARPEVGPFPAVSVAEDAKKNIISRMKTTVARSGWRVMMAKAARIVIDRIESHGLRFEITCEELSRLLGLSKSMGSYYLKRLRDEGFIERFRQHYVDWEATFARRIRANRDDLFVAAPSVHQVCLPRSDDAFRSLHPGIYLLEVSMDEKPPLTRGSAPPA